MNRPKLQKRHFDEIANIIARERKRSYNQRYSQRMANNLVIALGEVLALYNECFDHDKFHEACGNVETME